MFFRRYLLRTYLENKLDDRKYIKKFVSKALYGTLLVMSLIVAIDDHYKSAGQVIISLLTTVLVFAISQFYSDVVAEKIVSKEKLTREKVRNIFYEIAPISIGSHTPTIIFLFALVGLISIEKAFFLAKVAGLGALFLYGFLIGKYSNRSKGKCYFSGAVNMLMGGIVVMFKTLIH